MNTFWVSVGKDQMNVSPTLDTWHPSLPGGLWPVCPGQHVLLCRQEGRYWKPRSVHCSVVPTFLQLRSRQWSIQQLLYTYPHAVTGSGCSVVPPAQALTDLLQLYSFKGTNRVPAGVCPMSLSSHVVSRDRQRVHHVTSCEGPSPDPTLQEHRGS